MSDPYRAPDFPSQDTWFRTDLALSVPQDLSGQVVILHFFSVSSVHCAHQSQVLAALESRFAGRPFVVVGVHVPREKAERSPDYLRAALDRLAIHNPVVMDKGLKIWKAYNCSSLPTITVIDASGNVRFQGSGEADRERLGAAVQSLLDESEDDQQYAHRPTQSRPLPPPQLDRLRSPAGLAVDEERSLLWIADTGNDRVLACDLDTGKVQHVIGSGRPGVSGGNFDVARFSRPRGIAAREEGILVADSANHLIRQFDIDCGEVNTLVGQARPVVDLFGGACWDDQGFASPWDLALHDDRLFVAMSGLHQVWTVDLHNGSAEAFAGQGHEAQVDGTRHDAAFAQPEAIAVQDETLGIVDRATGQIRFLDLQSDMVVSGATAFSSPRAIAAVPDGWLVGDTVGIHRVTPDGEPLGFLLEGVVADAIVVHDQLVFIADASNHRILCVPLEGGEAKDFALSFEGQTFAADEQEGKAKLLADASVTLRMALDCPFDMQLPLDTPVRASVRQVEGAVLKADQEILAECYGTVVLIHGLATACVPAGDEEAGDEGVSDGATDDGATVTGVIEITLQFALCLNEDAAWHQQTQRLRLAVSLRTDGSDLSDAVLTAID